MTQSDFEEGLDKGKRDAARELQPLVDAIADAIFLFNEVGEQSALTPRQRGTLNGKCRDMAKQLRRLVALSGLKGSNE